MNQKLDSYLTEKNILSSAEMKNIIGGNYDPPPLTSCTVYCDGKPKDWDCGVGVSCTTVGQTVYCGDGNKHEPCKKTVD